MTKSELNIYFKSDKSDWFEIVNGQQKWDLVKVSEFWQLLRENRNNQYSKYVFPAFERFSNGLQDDSPLNKDENFWKIREKKEFINYVSFNTAKFLGEAHFSGVKFKKGADFIGTKFTQAVLFKRAYFIDFMWFGFSEFSKNAYMQAITFNGYTDFYDFTFKGLVTFENSKFLGKVDFHKLNFENECNFKNVKFYSDCKVLFQDLGDDSNLSFENVYFSKNVIFRRFNLKNTRFLQSDIIDLNIKECNWSNSNRIITKDEIEGLSYQGLEGIYRQFKKNYENAKDWELSGRAYRSEMLMRRFSLYSSFSSNWFNPIFIVNNDFWEWLFYWIYGRFSGFTQSILTPFFLLVSTIFCFAFVYYFNDVNIYSNFWNCSIVESISYIEFLDSLKYSISTSIPLFKSNLSYSNWWLYSLEKLISSILIIFFILALRKRFKH